MAGLTFEISFLLPIFFTLFFVVDPLGLIPFFLTTLQRFTPARRRWIILKASLIAALISMLFLFAGDFLLEQLAIEPEAFFIAGGVLLFLIAIDMLYARPSARGDGGGRVDSSGEVAGGDDAPLATGLSDHSDPTVFPLAIPMLSGPGNIAALLMFAAQADGFGGKLVVGMVSLFVFGLSASILLAATYLMRLLGATGLSVLHRLMGLILAALAVQFLINGLRGLGIL